MHFQRAMGRLCRKEEPLMKVYRSSMEKILDKQENDTIITNPKEPVRTFLRKAGFILSRWADKAKRILRESGASGRT
jgi:hypothetical protein